MSKTEIESFVEEVVEDQIIQQNDEKIPNESDPEWVDYIIDNLADHEIVQGNPTTDGLRRVTEKVFGEIIFSDTEILEVPKDMYGKTTAKHTLTIAKYRGNTITVSACVDVIGKKVPYPFKEHLIATACTRAEGKALRRALKVRIHTAEELCNSDEEEVDSNELINDQQLAAIRTLSKRLDVDMLKFIKSNTKKKIKSIKDITNIEGRLMINALSSYQREGVPKELIGFKEEMKF